MFLASFHERALTSTSTSVLFPGEKHISVFSAVGLVEEYTRYNARNTAAVFLK